MPGKEDGWSNGGLIFNAEYTTKKESVRAGANCFQLVSFKKKGFAKAESNRSHLGYFHTMVRVRNTCVQVENPGMKIMFPPTGFQYLANEIQLEGKGSLLTSAHPFSLRGSKLSFPSSNSHGQDSWHSGCAQIQNQPSWGQFWGTGIQNGKTENAHQSLTECPLSVWAVPRLRFPRPLSISEGQM